MKTKWYYLINPCDMDRHKALVLVGDALAKVYEAFTYGTDCGCCLGARVIALAALAFTAGVLI